MHVAFPAIYILVSCIPMITSLLQFLLSIDVDCNAGKEIESLLLVVLTMSLITTTCCILCANEDIFTFSSKNNMILGVLFVFYFVQYILVIHIYSTSHNVSCTEGNVPDIVEYLLLSWIIIYSVSFILLIIALQKNIKIGFTDFDALIICVFNTQLILIMIPTILQLILMTSNKCKPHNDTYLFESILSPILVFAIFITGFTFLTMQKSDNVGPWIISAIFLWFVHYGIVLHICFVYWHEDIECGEFESMKIASYVFFVILGIEYTCLAVMGGGAALCSA